MTKMEQDSYRHRFTWNTGRGSPGLRQTTVRHDRASARRTRDIRSKRNFVLCTPLCRFR